MPSSKSDSVTNKEDEFMELSDNFVKSLRYEYRDDQEYLKDKIILPAFREFHMFETENGIADAVTVQGFIEAGMVPIIRHRICNSHNELQRVVFDSDLRACYKPLRDLLYRRDDHRLLALEFRHHKLENQELADLVRGTGVEDLSLWIDEAQDMDYLFGEIPGTVTKLTLLLEQPNRTRIAFPENGLYENVLDLFPGPTTIMRDLSTSLHCLHDGIEELKIDFRGSGTFLLDKILQAVASLPSIKKLELVSFHGRSASELLAVLSKHVASNSSLEALVLVNCVVEDGGNCKAHMESLTAAIQNSALTELSLHIDFFIDEPELFGPYATFSETGVKLMKTVLQSLDHKSTLQIVKLKSAVPSNSDIIWNSQGGLSQLFDSLVAVIRMAPPSLSSLQITLEECYEIEVDDVRDELKGQLECALAENFTLSELTLFPLLFKRCGDERLRWYGSSEMGQSMHNALQRNKWLGRAKTLTNKFLLSSNETPTCCSTSHGLWANALAAIGSSGSSHCGLDAIYLLVQHVNAHGI
ncbi:hypothetical protein ACA910_006358 [Epithemia clementina (nom. ined.)]